MQKKLIISDPAIKLGRPVVAGTRVAVDELLDRLAAGATVAELVAAHPGLSAAAVLEALRFAADAVRRDSPLAAKSPLELNGPQPLALPAEDREAARPALAVRAYLPDAASVSLRRLPPPPSGRAWIPALDPAAGPGADAAALPTLHPMERVHPEGVFEAVFPGETEPFAYQLAVRSGDGETRVTDSAHGLPPALAAADLAAWPEASAPVAAGAPAPGRWH